MGRLTPEKFSQRLQDLNRYLDYIPIEKTIDSLRVTKSYGKYLPEDELRSIMGRAIPPEWTVNLLSLGKKPWKFRDQYGKACIDAHVRMGVHDIALRSKDI
jgi:hypothetical protein